VALDPDLAYVVVSDPDGAVLAHTFGSKIPGWVFSPELVAADRSGQVLFQSEDDGRLFREQAEPVLDGRLGVVRVGLDESGIRTEVKSLLSVLAAMVTTFLVSGIAATIWISRRITKPLSSIIRAVETFDLGGHPVAIDVATGDELEVVADHVRAMTRRLQSLYRTERLRDRELARVERLASLGTLAAGLAHELNNPLAGIKSAAQRLPRLPAGSPRVAEYAAVIVEASRRMERVLKSMLDFSRPQEVNLEDTTIADCVSSAIELSRAKVRRSCIGVELQPALPPIKADPDLLVQVLLNLLLNAADAVGVCEGDAECDVPMIVISAESREDVALIRVRDSGPGVPEELREKVFDPFFTSKPAGRGTGLGLSTAWSLMMEMGGNLILEPPSESGGACFAVTVQVAKKGQ